MESAFLRNVVNQQRSQRVSIVCVSDGSISFLASSVPDLSPHVLVFHFETASSKLHSDCRLGVLFELVLCVPEQKLGLAHTRVTDQNYLKEVVVMVLVSGC